MNLPDIQSTEPPINKSIKQVGVENVTMPFFLKGKYGGQHEIITNISVRCYLDKNKKGISMSRCIRTLKSYINRPLSQSLIKMILYELTNVLESHCVYLKANFKFPIFRKSVKSDNVFPVYYDSMFEGRLELNKSEPFQFFQGMRVQYASYCPCSAELSKDLELKGSCGFPHNQRSFANIIIESQEAPGVWLEDINEIVETVIPTLPYAIIKREDEQRIAEIAAQNPLFVEDAIRLISNELDKDERIFDWFVKCIHEESIHTSEAIAINFKGYEDGLNEDSDLQI